jgi:hypothetical protein
MADHQDVPMLGEMALRLPVHFADQGAGRVVIIEIAPLGLGRDGLRHAMRAEHDMGVGRHFVQFLDEDGALRLQRFHDGAVMDDFVAHIDGGAEAANRFLHHPNGPVDACAEAARP